MMVKVSILQVIYVIFLSTARVNCFYWSVYRERKIYANKFCPVISVEQEFLASNLMICSAECQRTPGCIEVIYNWKTTTCYRLKSDFDHDDCVIELIGARMYRQEDCPPGWIFLYRSCYKTTTVKLNQDKSEILCRSFNKHSHLADLDTDDEYQEVMGWIWDVNIEDYLWLILTSNQSCQAIEEIRGIVEHLNCVINKLKGLCEMDLI